MAKKHTESSTKSFPERLRAWRNACGLTREQAAREFGVSLRTFDTWELPRTNQKRIALIVAVVERLIKEGF